MLRILPAACAAVNPCCLIESGVRVSSCARPPRVSSIVLASTARASWRAGAESDLHSRAAGSPQPRRRLAPLRSVCGCRFGAAHQDNRGSDAWLHCSPALGSAPLRGRFASGRDAVRGRGRGDDRARQAGVVAATNRQQRWARLARSPRPRPFLGHCVRPLLSVLSRHHSNSPHLPYVFERFCALRA